MLFKEEHLSVTESHFGHVLIEGEDGSALLSILCCFDLILKLYGEEQ